MSFLLDLEIIKDVVVGLGASVTAASALSLIRAYLGKKVTNRILVGNKSIELKGMSKNDIQKLLEEIVQLKKNPQVFIMYSHDEKELAKRITEDLSSEGIKTWIDENQLKPGDSITEKINIALDESQWIIFIPPKSTSNKDAWVSKELNVALKSEKWRSRHFVIPIKTQMGQIPDNLKDRLWVDFSSSYAEGIEKLKKGILRNQQDASDKMTILAR